MSEWSHWQKAFTEESEQRLDTDVNTLCTYGIKPLDDALFRIAKNELIVIGADSGVGKSEIALRIARDNAQKGRSVALSYLEGGHIEALARMKWLDICDEYYENHFKAGIDMDFRKWRFNYKQDLLINRIESIVYERYKKLYEDNLYLFSITEGLTVEEFTDSLIHGFGSLGVDKFDPHKIRSELQLDLIVIDHLQYFSLGQAETEISAITRIIRECKRITDFYRIPIVLISHLRKKTKDRGLPDQADFYGSSNIPKISSTAITITPATDKDNLAAGVFPTYFRIVKSRVGLRPNYAILCDFNLNHRKYDDSYSLYRVDSAGYVCADSLRDEELPKWAKKEKV